MLIFYFLTHIHTRFFDYNLKTISRKMFKTNDLCPIFKERVYACNDRRDIGKLTA